MQYFGRNSFGWNILAKIVLRKLLHPLDLRPRYPPGGYPSTAVKQNRKEQPCRPNYPSNPRFQLWITRVSRSKPSTLTLPVPNASSCLPSPAARSTAPPGSAEYAHARTAPRCHPLPRPPAPSRSPHRRARPHAPPPRRPQSSSFHTSSPACVDANLLRRLALIDAVVPLLQPVFDLRHVPIPGDRAGLLRPLHRARKHRRKLPCHSDTPAAPPPVCAHARSARYPSGSYAAPLRLHSVSPCRISHSSAISILRTIPKSGSLIPDPDP